MDYEDWKDELWNYAESEDLDVDSLDEGELFNMWQDDLEPYEAMKKLKELKV